MVSDELLFHLLAQLCQFSLVEFATAWCRRPRANEISNGTGICQHMIALDIAAHPHGRPGSVGPARFARLSVDKVDVGSRDAIAEEDRTCIRTRRSLA